MRAFWVWLGATASYMVLAGQFSLDEIATGAVLGGCAACWDGAVMRDGARRFAFEPRAAGVIGRALLSFPAATLRVGARLAACLVAGGSGRRIVQPFEHGPLQDPCAAGRRAVVVLASSLAPDSYVLRLPPGAGAIGFHVLTAEGPTRDPRWPA